jgi:hypothetical protein
MTDLTLKDVYFLVMLERKTSVPWKLGIMTVKFVAPRQLLQTLRIFLDKQSLPGAQFDVALRCLSRRREDAYDICCDVRSVC